MVREHNCGCDQRACDDDGCCLLVHDAPANIGALRPPPM
jgi:hypothetical protein